MTEGVFLADGTFLPLPKLASEPFVKLWEQEVFALLLAEGNVPNTNRRRLQQPKHWLAPPAPEKPGRAGRR